MPRPKRLLLLGLSLVSASFLGWSIAASLTSQTTAFANRTDEDLQVEQLLDRLQEQGELEPHTRRTLLDGLLAQGRFEDALIVLQPWLSEQPRSLNLALLNADLHRLTGNTDGALKELKRLLRLHPGDAQVLQLLVLVEQTKGSGKQALQDLQKRFSDQPPGSRLELGLLVADVQRLEGQPQAASKMYAQLAAESPTDSRPPLALALLKRDQGQVQEVQALLQQTRQRRTAAGGDTILIDQLAVNWGLSAARINPTKTTIPTTKAAADRP
jgi:tetratricopeptide (TPR) repeat protein